MEDDVQKWVAQGFGQGEGDSYRPWAKVRDVPSLGRCTRIVALRHKRIHHLYSDVETGHFLQADFAPGVTEVREQFALLPRDETIEIAAELGLRHPTYPGTQVHIVMTSDLCVLRERQVGGPFVLCVKRDEALQPKADGLKRTLEKLLIEKCYWDRRSVTWRLVSQQHFDATLVRNLALLRPSGKLWRSKDGNERAAQFAERVLSSEWREFPMRQLLEATGWSEQQAFETLGHAIWRRLLPVDLTHPLNLNRPLNWLEGMRDAA
ncbi:TnsA endonuclease N-terminal domain-containing protein [Pseudoxanthomonas mexicana]